MTKSWVYTIYVLQRKSNSRYLYTQVTVLVSRCEAEDKISDVFSIETNKNYDEQKSATSSNCTFKGKDHQYNSEYRDTTNSLKLVDKHTFNDNISHANHRRSYGDLRIIIEYDCF